MTGTSPISDKPAGTDEWRSPEETARIRDEAFRRLMKMPPKPQEEMKLGRARGESRAAVDRVQQTGRPRATERVR